MARKTETKIKGAKKAAAGRAKVPEVTAPAPRTGRGGKVKGAKAAARAARSSVAAADLLPTSAGAAVDAGTKTAKKALRSAKAQAKRLVPDVSVPEIPSLGGLDIGSTARSIGNQVLGALNTDVGRVMVAELLIFVAKSLTKAAADTDVGKDAKSTLLSAGAKIGAAAADAGAKMVETGNAAIESGREAAESGADTATKAAGSASDLMREVAQVAVGAMGGMVTDAATKMIKRRGGRGKAEPASDANDASAAEAAPLEVPDSGDTANPVDSGSGRRPPRI